VLILLPPSEGKKPPRRGLPLNLDGLSASELTPTRERVLDTLIHVSAAPDGLAQLGLSPGQADQLEANVVLRTAATARADKVYTGVLYEALGFDTLSPEGRRRASSRVAIVSSLFGILRPTDRIPAYRLSGGVNLPGLGPVAATWREVLDPVVSEMVGRGLLVDLRSSTYAAFWRPSGPLTKRVATVRVLHETNGKRSIVSHFNKATKGRLVRALLEDGANPRHPAALAETLTRLGWTVEVGDAQRTGTSLDVIVTAL
jgi:uncharacterized protein